jgi:hypothetical protein
MSKAKGADGSEKTTKREVAAMSFHKIVPVKKTRKPAPESKRGHRKHQPKKHEPKRPVGHK